MVFLFSVLFIEVFGVCGIMSAEMRDQQLVKKKITEIREILDEKQRELAQK